MYDPPENNQSRNPKEEESAKKSMKENIIRMALTSEARQRLTNIKMVKPDIARIIEDYVIQMAQTGKLTKTIDDVQLKEILSSLQERKKEFKIRWI
jgi:programmed cell death protein 5